MPVAHIHVVGTTPEQRREISAEVTRIYAEVLEAPVERIRVFVVDHDPGDVTVAGVNVGEGGAPAPFFTAIFFASRPVEQRHRLLREASEMLARVCDVDLGLVRAQAVPVAPDDWCIGGVPAAVARREEITARVAAADVDPS